MAFECATKPSRRALSGVRDTEFDRRARLEGDHLREHDVGRYIGIHVALPSLEVEEALEMGIHDAGSALWVTAAATGAAMQQCHGQKKTFGDMKTG